MSISALKLYCIWNSLCRMLCPATRKQSGRTDQSRLRRHSARRAKRVFFEMP